MVDYAQKALEESGYLPYYMYKQKYMSGNLENVGYCKKARSVYTTFILWKKYRVLLPTAPAEYLKEFLQATDWNDLQILRGLTYICKGEIK